MSMKKVKTMDLKGKDYAQVKDRVQEFRTLNPNGLIETTPTIQTDGQIMFKARVLKDKSEPSSAEATGHAFGKNEGAKAFEKLESIAVGRALALLGYGTDGAIASSEEMEEFERSQQSKKTQELLRQIDEIKDIETLRVFYKTNKGNGAVVDAYMMEKSKQFTNENPKTGAGKRGVAKRA